MKKDPSPPPSSSPGTTGLDDIWRAFEELREPPPAPTPAYDDSPIARMVNAILSSAIDMRASVLYYEPDRSSLRVRVRVDGLLTLIMQIPRHIQPHAIKRVKEMANLALDLTNHPQVGYIPIVHNKIAYTVRVQTYPTFYGETAVLHLLADDFPNSPRPTLGIEAAVEGELGGLLFPPGGGLLLLAGVPGSGVTTTAYALLRAAHSVTRKIVTIEEVREYPLPGSDQIYTALPPTGLKASVRDLTRAALRLPPDILFLGDLRTPEAASAAVEAGLSGVLTIATIAAPSAADAPHRLVDLGVPPEQAKRAVLGVLGQRLARRLCPECRVPVRLSAYEWEFAYRMPPPTSEQEAQMTVFSAAPDGCEACGKRGYKGQIGIFEVWKPDSSDEEQATGPLALRADAASKVRAGIVSPEEAARVVRTARGY